jgi:hypothetical protein
MDPLNAMHSSLPARQVGLSASRDAESALYAPAGPEPSFASDLMAALDSSPSKDPAAQQLSALHLLSHVDAACFISLLQIMDPKPDDYQGRVAYKRYYRKLEGVLTLPVPTKE